MLKKVSAMKARQDLGQLLNEVSIKGDSFYNNFIFRTDQSPELEMDWFFAISVADR